MQRKGVEKMFDRICLILVIIGGLNWGLVGIFNFNLVDWIFGGYNAGSIIGILTFLITAFITLVCYRNSKAYKEEDTFQ